MTDHNHPPMTNAATGTVKLKCSCGKWVKNGTAYFDFAAGKVNVSGCCGP